jgi:hypothetical protein
MLKDMIIALLRRGVGNGGAVGVGGGEADGQGVQLEGGDVKPPDSSVANCCSRFFCRLSAVEKKN